MTWEHRLVDLETFLALDGATRDLVLRLLDEPQEKAFAELHAHPNAKVLASWLLELPAIRDAYADGDAP